MAKEEDSETSKFLYYSYYESNSPKKPYGSNLLLNIKKYLALIYSIIVKKGIKKDLSRSYIIVRVTLSLSKSS